MSEQLEGICEVCGKSRIECRKNLLDSVKNASEADPINHPSHYTDGGIETIDFIEAKKLNYNCGNATKYISRAGKKDKAERAVDIAKAIWYLQRELDTLKGK
jgi:hypothetical protein